MKELVCAIIIQAVEDWKGRYNITSLQFKKPKQFYKITQYYWNVKSAYEFLTNDNIWWSMVDIDHEYLCSQLNITGKDMEEYERIFERLRYQYHTMYEQR